MKSICVRELRNRSGEILRQVEAGQQFTITVEARPVAMLVPCQRRRWVPKVEVLNALRAGLPDFTFFEETAEVVGTSDDLRDP